MNEVEKTMNDFAHRVVHSAKLNLFPGALKESIRYDLDVFPNSFGLAFFMNVYGLFQDKGVSGTQIKYNTKFSYKSDATASAKKKDSHASFVKIWAKRKQIRLRDKDGKYQRGNYNTIGFLIARSIKRKGIKPSLFFTRPFEAAFKDLPDDVVKAYGLELDKTFDTWLTKPNLI